MRRVSWGFSDSSYEARAVVNEASEFATHDAEPDPSELYTDVYTEAAA